MRWNHVYNILLQHGIVLMGFSSDGFSAFLKAMKDFSGIPTFKSDCPEKFKWFYFASWDPLFLCIQDGTHMVVKAFRALMTKELVIGSRIANKSVLIALTKEFPRMIVGISERQLTENIDAMNFDIAEKVCSERVTDRLLRPEELWTKTFLLLMRHIIKAYVDPTTATRPRLFSAWYVAFFCRLWKSWLKDSTPDALKSQDFIASNHRPKFHFIKSPRVYRGRWAPHALILQPMSRHEATRTILGKPDGKSTVRRYVQNLPLNVHNEIDKN